ncbi:hypothetical protein VNO77_15819 [Canavalia gladiata]|uniref:Late embryogenesis abundant protein LEA-2 subgroup domain-containing protein n=1 Tax=Canavalia gladiata TaxID=3824 RepID=A0AAN9QW11_CANGL
MASSNQEKTNSQAQPPPPPPPSSPPSTQHTSEKNANLTPASPLPITAYSTHPPPYPPPYPMYYPPPGYPMGQNPNPHAYPHGYAYYTNTYPAGYHYPPTNVYYGPPPTSSASSRFYRSFILCSCMLLMCFFLFSLIVTLALRPRLPVYKVASFSVTNFSTAPTLTGQWNMKITIENPNEKLVAYFSDLKVDVAYKDGVVAVNYASGFVLNRNDQVDMSVTASPKQAERDMIEKNTMEDLVKDRGTGSVTFSLKVSSVNMFKSGSYSTRSLEVVAICEGLKVVFQNNNPSGTVDNGGKPIECLLYV